MEWLRRRRTFGSWDAGHTEYVPAAGLGFHLTVNFTTTTRKSAERGLLHGEVTQSPLRAAVPPLASAYLGRIEKGIRPGNVVVVGVEA